MAHGSGSTGSTVKGSASSFWVGLYSQPKGRPLHPPFAHSQEREGATHKAGRGRGWPTVQAVQAVQSRKVHHPSGWGCTACPRVDPCTPPLHTLKREREQRTRRGGAGGGPRFRQYRQYSQGKCIIATGTCCLSTHRGWPALMSPQWTSPF